MATTMMKLETETETCCVCGGGGELLTPEEHDAGAPPLSAAPPLRTMLLHLNNNKVIPEGRICMHCARRAHESFEFSAALGARAAPPLSEKIRALRRRLHDLTQKIDVFIVVGGAGAAGGTYSEEDIIMVEKEALAAAAAADDEDLERARNARGDSVYQCSVCPLSFQRVAEYRAHAGSHPADALHSCWTCGAQFSAAAALRDHAESHAAPPATCRLCRLDFTCQSSLRRHEASCPSRCPACGELCADRAALSQHCAAQHGRAAAERQHEAAGEGSGGVGGAPLACPACYETFPASAPDQLAAHLLRHRQARQFVCGHDGCILRFGTRNNLMSHIRKCHGGAASPPAAGAPGAPGAAAGTPAAEDSTTCVDCGRTFGSVAAMKRHARVHRAARAAQLQAQAQSAELSMETDEPEGEVEYLEVEALEDGEYAVEYSEYSAQYADLKPDLAALQ